MERIYCDSSIKESCVVYKDTPYIEAYSTLQTNNAGEYQAAIAAVKLARQLGVADFVVFTDSKLVVNQTKGINKCKAQNLAPYRTELRALLGGDHIAYSNLHIEWIPREENPAGIILEGR
jgi:ribonuclease HI